MILQADARSLPLTDRSAHLVVTSPPYWGLRDYGHERQLGMEASPLDYVANMVTVFREVWRVLRDDGSVWLNLGDSYARTGGTDRKVSPTAAAGNTRRTMDIRGDRTQTAPAGMKDKDLVGIPWRVAFALQAAGWYLRSDIIWAKPNPMPESVTDRPTRSHEYIFLLTKKPKYYYDAEAIRERAVGAHRVRRDRFGSNKHHGGTTKHSDGSVFVNAMNRNRRSVWTVTAKPYRGAHFATFPPDLIEPCILAGSSPQCCSACGAPYRRLTAKGNRLAAQQRACGGDADGAYHGTAQKDFNGAHAQNASEVKARILAGMFERHTVGWKASCACHATPTRALVLDPFGGSGTTAMVAERHGRVGVALDTKFEYCLLAQQRCDAAAAARDSETAQRSLLLGGDA